jgi:hypothetical protein
VLYESTSSCLDPPNLRGRRRGCDEEMISVLAFDWPISATAWHEELRLLHLYLDQKVVLQRRWFWCGAAVPVSRVSGLVVLFRYRTPFWL